MKLTITIDDLLACARSLTRIPHFGHLLRRLVLPNRATLLSYMTLMPGALVATETEVLKFIEDRRLWGRGLGWTDVHLLASAMLSQCKVWTFDRRLSQAASQLGLDG